MVRVVHSFIRGVFGVCGKAEENASVGRAGRGSSDPRSSG